MKCHVEKIYYLVQMVRFHFVNGMVVEGTIGSYDGPFGAVVTFPWDDRVRHVQGQMFPPVATPDQAFRWLLDAACGHCVRVESGIEKIDNPWGTPLIGGADQWAVLGKKGLVDVVLLTTAETDN